MYEELYGINPEDDSGKYAKVLYQIQYTGVVNFMGKNDLCFCGSGKKVGLCHPHVNEASLVASLLKLYDSIDKRNMLAQNACKRGCADCCTDDFDIPLSEFIGILYYLGIGNERALGKSWRALIDKWNPSVNGMCLFLHPKKRSCSIYAVRPIVCRNYGSVVQYTEQCDPCIPMSKAPNPPKLIDEDDYPFIDVITNRYKLKGSGYIYIPPKPRPIAVWVDSINSDDILCRAKVWELLAAATQGNVDDFINVLRFS